MARAIMHMEDPLTHTVIILWRRRQLATMTFARAFIPGFDVRVDIKQWALELTAAWLYSKHGGKVSVSGRYIISYCLLEHKSSIDRTQSQPQTRWMELHNSTHVRTVVAFVVRYDATLQQSHRDLRRKSNAYT